MATSSKANGWIILAVLVVLLLAALNPTSDDFVAWRSAQAQGRVDSGGSSGIVGALKSGAGAVAGAVAGIEASGYKRSNYYLFSVYGLGGERYLGVARLFIKLK